MKKLLMFSALIMTLTFVQSCEKQLDRPKDTVFFNLVGPVKSSVHSFDYSNKTTKEDYAPKTVSIEFNPNGTLRKTTRSSVDQTKPNAEPMLSSSTYNYRDDGKLESLISNPDVGHSQKLKYLYKDGARHPYASVVISEKNTQMTLMKHDESGNLISAKTLDDNGETDVTYSATFNKKNQPLMYKNSFGDSYKAVTTFKYNDKGFTHSETRDYNGDKSVMTYKYLKTDDKGNWIERKILSESDEGYAIEKREISYY